MTSAGPAPEVIRHGIRDLLGLLADLGQQRAYERDVPIAQVPAELVCMWFDDLYHPDHAGFRRAFSAPELVALEAFDRAYRLVADEVKPLPTSVAVLHAHPAWGRVSSGASEALKLLEGVGAR